MRFEELSELKSHSQKWNYEFYKEEKYSYTSFAIEPPAEYEIRALCYSNGSLLTLAKLANGEEFQDKPEILRALKMGPFDGQRDTIERCMNATLWKIGNAIDRALEVLSKKSSE